MTFIDSGGDEPGRSVRLIFEYEGDEVRLVLQQPVDVAVTGFDLARTTRPGNYVEVRDASGAAMARVPVREAMEAGMEVFPEDHSQPITRTDAPTSGAFTVVVPAGEAAARVALVRLERPAPEAAAPGAAPAATAAGGGDAGAGLEVTELASFDLDPSDGGA